MIYDQIKNLGNYRGLNANLDCAIDYIEQNDLNQLAEGKHPIDGDNAYVMIQSLSLKAPQEAKWETHEAYVDVQIALADGEFIAYAPKEDIKNWSEYDPVKERYIAMSDYPGLVLPMRAGMFAIFFPDDGHKGGVRLGEVAQLRKAVVKFRFRA